MNELEFEIEMSNIEKFLKRECIFYFFTNDKKFTLKKEIAEFICNDIIDNDINCRIIRGANIHDPQFLKKTLEENNDIPYKFIFIDKNDSTYMILSDGIRDEIIDYVYKEGKESLDIVLPRIINSKINEVSI